MGENKATTALVRLIELTASIRTTSESGLHQRVPGMIKAGLDRFLAWAAEDGGYSHLRVVPNIITEVVDAELQGSAITALLQRRVRALARLQREFLREDRDPDFWHLTSTSSRGRDNDADDDHDGEHGVADRNCVLLQRYLSPRKRKGHVYLGRTKRHTRRRHGRCGDETAMEDDELARASPTSQTASATDGTAAAKRRRTFVSPISELDDLAMSGDPPAHSFSSPSERQAAKRLFPSPPPPPAAATVRYRRRPPVVYALFIIDTTVFVLTVDAALDDDAYISFHVEIEFMDQYQSVWNALTLAMVSCLARDDMRRRADDFEPLTEEEEESDPDA